MASSFPSSSASPRASLQPMRKARLLLPAVLGLACIIAAAQPATVPNPALTQVRLADSSISLSGPWKFAPGDSPKQQDGSLLWASPAFDDASWANMDLHAKPGEIDAYYGNPGYLTGWSARGYPHLAGFAWYRLRVHIDNSPAPLWIKMPPPHRRLLPGLCQRPVCRRVRPLHSQRRDLLPLAAPRVRAACA